MRARFYRFDLFCRYFIDFTSFSISLNLFSVVAVVHSLLFFHRCCCCCIHFSKRRRSIQKQFRILIDAKVKFICFGVGECVGARNAWYSRLVQIWKIHKGLRLLFLLFRSDASWQLKPFSFGQNIQIKYLRKWMWNCFSKCQ